MHFLVCNSYEYNGIFNWRARELSLKAASLYLSTQTWRSSCAIVWDSPSSVTPLQGIHLPAAETVLAVREEDHKCVLLIDRCPLLWLLRRTSFIEMFWLWAFTSHVDAFYLHALWVHIFPVLPLCSTTVWPWPLTTKMYCVWWACAFDLNRFL